jgi:hypothetical protein
MTNLRRLTWLVLWCGVAGGSAGAQDAVSPLPGALLRVTAPSLSPKPIEGTLVQTTQSELLLDLANSERRSVPRAAVARLEWSRGRRGNVAKGVLWGALIGGTVVAVAAGDECDGGSYEPDCVAGFFLGGASLGALGGAGVGALIKTEDWGEVPIANVRVTMAPVSGGAAIRLALTW